MLSGFLEALRLLHLLLFFQANKLVKYLLVKDQTKIPIKRSGSVLPIFAKLTPLSSPPYPSPWPVEGVPLDLYGILVLSYLYPCFPHTPL